ncbi:very short patch repair endonuclease [Rahnella sp. AN3-3W3]|jgi:DNA mismatch endonuclease (patch repair protein)|uniref:very short patch repair endonuclease n=1 Tax=Rahnella sp. AN3-3W3 TaxID=1610578 RepID=UPI000DD30238|nr:very short patch repair endonuclease [Rahnella sp. AN3-3W3]
MTDVHNKATRRKNMAAIKNRGTKPERMLLHLLRKRGYSPLLNVKELPGTPDLVLPEYGVVIFVHGCFWHGHENCKYFRLPATRPEFWLNKIMHSKQRDKECISQLLAENYRVAIFWECSLRSLPPHMINFMLSGFDAWIHDASSDRIEFSSSTVS